MNIQTTNPLGADMDSDGILDAEEQAWGWSQDSDDRDVRDASGRTHLETALLSPSLVPAGPATLAVSSFPSTVQPSGTAEDQDADLMPDAWELAHGLNPTDPTAAALDSDGDGLTNLQESLLGTDPQITDDRSLHVRPETGSVATRLAVRVDRNVLLDLPPGLSPKRAKERLDQALRHPSH